MVRKLKILTIIVIALNVLVLLTGCSEGSASKQEMMDKATNLWKPVEDVWNWLWYTFSPKYWSSIEFVFDLPSVISWIAIIVVYALSAVLYVVFICLSLVAELVMGVVIGLVVFVYSIIIACS